MARFLKDKQQAKGTAPGSLIFIGQQKLKHTKIIVRQYNNNYFKEGELKSFSNLTEYLSDDHITWFSLFGLHDIQLIENLGTTFNINSLILEDILNTDERPKFIEDEYHIFIIAKNLEYDPVASKVQMEQISIIAGKNYLISIQETETDHFQDICRRLSAKQAKIRNYTTDYLCYALMDTLVDSYILNIEKLGSNIEAQEKDLLTCNKQIIENIYHYKTELSYIRKNIRPAKEIISRFINCDSELINKRTYTYLRDLDGLVTQAIEVIEIYYMMVSDQQNSYNANINNNVNDVMKILTIFSAVFIPLTFLAGVYGMNFENMPELKYEASYFILWAVMIGIALLMLIFFKRKKWL
ncbi:MAG: magnesium/cobalt transporter CorA [Odoribacter sp.]|nr:magnesium/cobalt transporter CorA [Odoribacter sp.]MDY3033791.1 magnesium/cobalt transporter CorA [Odoribacter sp.]